MQLTRRNLVQGGALALGATALASGLHLNAANAVAQTPQGLIYEGVARGMRGRIAVHVTLTDDAIAAIEVVKNTEMPVSLSEAAIAAVVPAIIDAQTVNVDTVTGATLSSLAVINAVTAALEAASVAEQFQGEALQPEFEAPADDTCDILVVGAGIAGSNAALAAKYDVFGREPNDLRVILIEECGFPGGSARLSGGTFFATQPLNSTASIDRFFAADFPSYPYEGFPLSEGLARNLLEASGTNALQLQQLGFPFVTIAGLDEPEAYDSLVGWFDQPRPPHTSFGEGVWDFAGYKIMDAFEEQLPRSGVEVRVNTEAKQLVVEDGAVTGVVVEGPAGSYTINAKKVILATGGISQNPELVAQYCPSYVKSIMYTAAGCKGDGILMAQAVDAVVDGFDAMGGPLGVDMFFGPFSDMGYDFYEGLNFPAGCRVTVVNANGERFMTDNDAMVADEGPLPKTVTTQPDGLAWSIFDSAHPCAATADASAMQESIYRADSLEELAKAIDVPADALRATVDAVNAAIEQDAPGESDPFGVAGAQMSPITEAPFYAVATRGCVCMSHVGLRIAEHCEVVDSTGAIVPNLYAVGETAQTGTTLTCLGGGLATGRVAGDHARESIA